MNKRLLWNIDFPQQRIFITLPHAVIPAQAGIFRLLRARISRFYWNDGTMA